MPAPDSVTPSGALWTPAVPGSVSTVTAATSSVASFVTVTGSDTVNFRQQYAAAGMKDDFMLWTVDDEEVVTTGLGPEVSGGDYVSFDYFMSIEHPNNAPFLERFKQKFGQDALMNTVGVAMYNAAHMAAVATKGAMHPQPHQDSQGNYTPVADKFSDTIDEVATERAAHYFSQADRYFLDMQHQQATESLASAVTCSIAAIAARNDWFHDDDGIHEAVELLATGQSPEITGDIHQALARSSELGHDLTSAFSAAMAQPDLVKFGMGYDSASGSDEDARNFARRTIQLADRLNAERRATA